MKKKLFETSQSDLLKYNGQDFVVIRPLEAGKEYDEEVGEMFEIQFSDGFKTDALFVLVVFIVTNLIVVA
jgi:hypothetical protein